MRKRHVSYWLGVGLVVLAVGLMANALLGPLVTGTIRYRFGQSLTNQGIAVDAVALFAAAPLALLAAVLTWRDHRAGPVLALIPATFAAYMAPQYVVGPDYLGMVGNNEQFFLLHLSLFIVALAVVLLAWTSANNDRLVPATPGSDRRRSWVLFGVAGFIVLGRWLPSLIAMTGGQAMSPDYLDNPTAFVLIGILDLGVVVPAAVTAAIGLRIGADWARVAAYAVIGWFALVPASVAAMSITMLIDGDPLSTLATTVVFCTAAAVFAVGATLLYRPLFSSEASDSGRRIGEKTRPIAGSFSAGR